MLGKGLRIQHRKGAMKRNGFKPTREGDVMTMDWIILKNETSRGLSQETVLLLVLDVAQDWLTAHSSSRRSGNAAYDGVTKAYGSRCKVKYARIDGGPELVQACKAHGIPFEVSEPYEHQANCLIEAHNRVELFGGRVSFEQCGAPLCFWPLAYTHFCD